MKSKLRDPRGCESFPRETEFHSVQVPFKTGSTLIGLLLQNE